MLENLRAKPIKSKAVKDGKFILNKNTPIQVAKKDDSCIVVLYEENEDETCYIHSQFNDDSFAIIGKEFYLNFYDDPAKVDLSYYYFSENKSVVVYLYDIKKTFSGIDVLIHLIGQWKSSICDAKYCVNKTEEYNIDNQSDIHIGVITEDNNVEKRNQELQKFLDPEPVPDKLPSYFKMQHQADSAADIRKRKLLSRFHEGKVIIDGQTYTYDIRLFDKKKHDMFFIDGVLNAAQIS